MSVASIYSAVPREALLVTVVPLGPSIVVENGCSRGRSSSRRSASAAGSSSRISRPSPESTHPGSALSSTRGKTIRREGGDLEIAGLSEDARAHFELTRLDTLFRIHDRAPEPAA